MSDNDSPKEVPFPLATADNNALTKFGEIPPKILIEIIVGGESRLDKFLTEGFAQTLVDASPLDEPFILATSKHLMRLKPLLWRNVESADLPMLALACTGKSAYGLTLTIDISNTSHTEKEEAGHVWNCRRVTIGWEAGTKIPLKTKWQVLVGYRVSPWLNRLRIGGVKLLHLQ